MELVILAIVAGLSFASYALWKQARGREEPRALPGSAVAGELAAGERTIHTVQVGDVVTHLGVDYLVEGAWTLDDDGRVTRLYRIADGGRVRWLGARPGEHGPLLLDEAADLVVESNGPESLAHRGLPYRLVARESPMATPHGAIARPAGRVHLYEYAGAGATRIVALAWPDRVEALVGERVSPHFVEILPGSPAGSETG